ncbi:MAG: hypothetical protein ACREQT_00705 [Candidatus Binataceae bacterium]
MRKIADIFDNAEAEMDAMGAAAFVSRLYSAPRTPEFTRLKEDWVLGSFATRFNKQYAPPLVWADRNPPRTKKADFSVYTNGRHFLIDIEILSLFSEPVVDNPKGYEDFSPFPCWRDPKDPAVMHLDIDQPRRSQPYARLERLVETHLRDHYAPYWLVIWDNEHGVFHPNLDDLSGRVLNILRARGKRRRLPTSLKEVWIVDETFPDARRVFPE